jgi:hypothetical protein
MLKSQSTQPVYLAVDDINLVVDCFAEAEL